MDDLASALSMLNEAKMLLREAIEMNNAAVAVIEAMIRDGPQPSKLVMVIGETCAQTKPTEMPP